MTLLIHLVGKGQGHVLESISPSFIQNVSQKTYDFTVSLDLVLLFPLACKGGDMNILKIIASWKIPLSTASSVHLGRAVPKIRESE